MSYSSNPARFVTRLLALVPLIFAVLTAFGVLFDEDQQTSITALLAGIAVLFGVGGEVVRSQVAPMTQVDQQNAYLFRLESAVERLDVNPNTNTKSEMAKKVRLLQKMVRGDRAA